MHLATDPATINGDRRLTPDEAAAYVGHHQRRNADNAQRAGRENILTSPGPGDIELHPDWSPARHDVAAFFRWVAQRLAQRFAGQPITIVDLGCGGAFIAPFLASAGLRGTYVGIDISSRGTWSTGPIGALQTKFIRADIATLTLEQIPAADVIVSATALEHIEHDRDAVQRLQARLSPQGVQAHLVPAEASLDLYGPHGWRQYSPACLRDLFPTCQIFRYGGPGTNRLHNATITRPLARGTTDGRSRHPALYTKALSRARLIDRHLSKTSPSMYGVLVEPSSH